MPRFARLASGFIVGTIILHLLWRALKGLGAAAIEDDHCCLLLAFPNAISQDHEKGVARADIGF